MHQTPTEADKGGALLYVSKDLNYITREDLNVMLNKSKELESFFIEITNINKKNIICACIYRHPCMELEDFNQQYLNPLLNKLFMENKNLYLIGDFNADLLKIDTETDISNYFDLITSYLLVPHITLPTRITETTKSLIDNIFSNELNFHEGISGKITLSISDHLAQFLIIPDNCDRNFSEHNLYKRDL